MARSVSAVVYTLRYQHLDLLFCCDKRGQNQPEGEGLIWLVCPNHTHQRKPGQDLMQGSNLEAGTEAGNVEKLCYGLAPLAPTVWCVFLYNLGPPARSGAAFCGLGLTPAISVIYQENAACAGMQTPSLFQMSLACVKFTTDKQANNNCQQTVCPRRASLSYLHYYCLFEWYNGESD